MNLSVDKDDFENQKKQIDSLKNKPLLVVTHHIKKKQKINRIYEAVIDMKSNGPKPKQHFICFWKLPDEKVIFVVSPDPIHTQIYDLECVKNKLKLE